MAFPRYESYQDSGLEWLGEIPTHWNLLRNKYLFKERVEKGFPDEPLLAATQSQGVVRKADYDARTVEATKDFHLLKLVKEGDFVISLRSFEGGIEYAYHQGIISPAYTVLTPRNHEEASYYKYFLKSPQFIQSLKLFVTGIREGQNIDYTKLSRSFLPCPPAHECVRIANFLDQKTAEIDEAIAKKQRLIELLKEQKAILINQAVTKGLNPDVSMRDSGVEWIGEVPAHWDVCRIKHGIKKITKGTTPSTEGKGFVDEGIRYFKAENIVDNEICLEPAYFIDDRTDRILSRSQLKSGDVLFVIAGATIGKTAVLSQEHTPSNTNQAVCLLRPSKFLLSEYLHLWLQSNFLENYIRVNAVQSAQPNISMEDLGNINMPMPPIKEQQSIVRELEDLVEPIVRLLKYQQHVIDYLLELRSIFISEAITGKIKI